MTPEECMQSLKSLRQNDEFQEYISGPTADEEMVKGRIRVAIEAFAE